MDRWKKSGRIDNGDLTEKLRKELRMTKIVDNGEEEFRVRNKVYNANYVRNESSNRSR